MIIAGLTEINALQGDAQARPFYDCIILNQDLFSLNLISRLTLYSGLRLPETIRTCKTT